MNKSKVYYSDMRATPDMNLLSKLERLIKKAGIGQIDFQDKLVAIKIHFGEPGNISFLRSNYVKVVVDTIKELGGKPFLTDCNTLYVGRRKNAPDHIEAAYENGFSPLQTGCHVIIADGLKGNDEKLISIDGELVTEAKIGTAIAEADVFISLTHFKCHEMTGIGGALKNIGMGSGSKSGKMEMHREGKPTTFSEKCKACGRCLRNCAHSAISFDENKKIKIDYNKCVGCGRCIGACSFDALEVVNDTDFDACSKKIAEYTHAVLKDKPQFHISLVVDVSPYCDCHSENDLPIIPDVGMFASFDAVALDTACVDMANKQPVLVGSVLDGKKRVGSDHFKSMHPTTDWRVCMEHAEKMGVGSMEYDLIKI